MNFTKPEIIEVIAHVIIIILLLIILFMCFTCKEKIKNESFIYTSGSQMRSNQVEFGQPSQGSISLGKTRNSPHFIENFSPDIQAKKEISMLMKKY